MKAAAINVGNPTHAICQGCMLRLEVSQFPVRNDRSGRYRPYCRECACDVGRARYAAYKRTSPFKSKLVRAKSRSQNLRVPFNLTAEYLESIWTGLCPVFGHPIVLAGVDRSDEWAAELDRFKPELGYVVGNVTFLSRRANRLKNNTTTPNFKNSCIG